MRYAVVTSRQSKDSHNQDIFQIEGKYTDYLYQFDLQPLVVSNCVNIGAIELLQPAMILLTGGGDIPAEYYISSVESDPQPRRDQIEKSLIRFAVHNDIPLLGICRGMQMINGYLGGKIERNIDNVHPIAVDHRIKTVLGDEEFDINSFHRDVILENLLSKELRVVMRHKEYPHIEAFTSDKHRILGLQWHPERLAQNSEGFAFSAQLVTNLLKGV